jgi:hypothetical protein
VLSFTSLLWIWKGEQAGRWYFLTVPDEQSGEIKAQAFDLPRGFGSVKVEAAIGDVRWRTSVFPLNTGGYVLPVKAEIRKRAGIGAGDEVTTRLTFID